MADSQDPNKAVDPDNSGAGNAAGTQGDDATKGNQNGSQGNQAVSSPGAAQVDYESELKRLQADLDRVTQERNNYETGLLNAKDELKKKKDAPSETPEDTRALIDETVNERLQSAVGTLKKDLTEGQVDSAIAALTTDQNEAKLIKFHLENTVKRSGYDAAAIIRDIQRARLLANEKRLVKENAELRQIARANDAITNSSFGTTQDPKGAESAPQLSAADKQYMEKMGLSEKDLPKQ